MFVAVTTVSLLNPNFSLAHKSTRFICLRTAARIEVLGLSNPIKGQCLAFIDRSPVFVLPLQFGLYLLRM